MLSDRRVTVRAVARLAGVSPTTAWRALTGRGGRVMPVYAARVASAVEQLKRKGNE